MRKKSMHVVLIASVLIFSSIAGCLANEATDEENDVEKATIVVSTYHVEQLVSAIAGDSLNVEILAPSNVPVHDYEPSATDLVRLQGADMFFYHGLGLETWIDATLDSLGDDAPLSFATHAMPGEESALDYEGMLLTEICELLAEGPYEANELESVDYHADDLELHAEPVAHTLSYATHDHGHDDHDDDHDDHADEHDDHGDEHDDHGDDHDDHGDDHDDHSDDHDDHGDDHADGHDDHAGHDDHGDHDDHHDEHAHAEAMETKTNIEGCPADTVVSIYELEEGEYVLEFETEDHDLSSFNMVALKMGGAHHHHHHHGHGDGPFEWAGIFQVNDDTHTWTMEKVDGSYADPSMRVVIIPTDTPNEGTMHSLESGVKDLIEGDCPVVNDGGMMTPIAADGSCFELTVNQDSDISSFDLDTSGMNGFAAYTAHSPYEFEATQHYLKDSQGNDVEHIAEEGGGGHGDHGDHDDDHGDDHDDHGDDEEMTPEELLEMLDSDGDGMLTWDEFTVLMTDDDDHHEACHDANTHETHDEYTNQADCEAAGHIWMEDHEEDGCHDTTTHETHDEYTNQADCEAAGHMWMEGDDDHDDHGDDHDDHAGEDDVHIDDEMMEVVHSIWNESDADMDGNLSGTELVEFIHDMDILFEAEEGVGYATIHIEAEGEYGFAVPAGVDMYILMAGDGHEGHDDHSGHDDHGDEHGDDHSDEDGDDHSDEEEALEYDPHSWLDPVAYKTQVQIVLDEMKKAFPDLADTFQANADAFMASLDEIDANYEAAFGANGTCTNRSVAANHNAYSYIAYRYDLQFVTVHGLDPEGEPSAADIAKVVEKIEEDEISVLFVEEYTDVTAVNSIVEQTNGVSVQVLYTMELPPKDSNDDYLSLMDKNLESLKAGLGC